MRTDWRLAATVGALKTGLRRYHIHTAAVFMFGLDLFIERRLWVRRTCVAVFGLPVGARPISKGLDVHVLSGTDPYITPRTYGYCYDVSLEPGEPRLYAAL